MTGNLDSFFEKYYSTSPRPPQVPFAFQKGDRLLLIGDSITETRRYSLMLETYLAVCMPELEVEVFNIGKGGETAESFLDRIDIDCLDYKPTVAIILYGMNDAGYIDNNGEAARNYRMAASVIVERLKASGSRVIMASPTCLGRLPSWDFVHELNGTLDGINSSLRMIRDESAAIAEREQLPFLDNFWNLYQARLTARDRFGLDYAVCGADDGVHPSWAGHVVIAFGLFTVLGFDGDLGEFAIDLAGKTASSSQDHAFMGETDGAYAFISCRYPFCAEGLLDKEWFIRSGMTLVPFNQNFNRMILKVTGTKASRYRVAWTDFQNMLEEWHVYTDTELQSGVNLADDFQLSPFSIPFHRINDLVFQKQVVESNKTWHTWENEGKPAEDGLAEYEAKRVDLLRSIKKAFVPVAHHIRIEALA